MPGALLRIVPREGAAAALRSRHLPGTQDGPFRAGSPCLWIPGDSRDVQIGQAILITSMVSIIGLASGTQSLDLHPPVVCVIGRHDGGQCDVCPWDGL